LLGVIALLDDTFLSDSLSSCANES